VSQGVAGELFIGGVGLARGYAGRAGLSAERFVADPLGEPGERLYRTGDLVRWSHRGELEYLGRIDHQVKIRGHRIELGEIEAQLLAQPEVGEAVVVAKDGPGGARLVGYVAGDAAGNAADANVLRERLALKLPPYMVPTAIVVLPALPKTANGKLDRKALPEPQHSVEGHEAPQGEIEQALAAIWAEVLGIDQVGRNDDFFELGGHSLMAARMIARVRAALQLDLSLRRVFECPQLHRLAACLSDAAAAKSTDLRPLPRTGKATLSPTQRRLWMVERMAETSAADRRSAYSMSAALRVSGPLDVARLRQTLDALVDRHEVLRTRYAEDDDGDPVAIIDAPSPIDLAVSELPPNSTDHAVQEVLAEMASRPFDLARGPLLRAKLLRFAPTEHVLVLSVHHIAFDGWSQAVFTREFVAIYTALCAGAAPRLPALPVQYADYAEWQSRKLEASQPQDSAFWRAYLAGAPRVSSLPPDHEPPPLASNAGDVVRLELPQPLVQRLEQLARAHQTTLYTVLLAAFSLWLHEETGAGDLVIGTDVAGRNDAQLEPLIGFFVNVVPLRSRRAGSGPTGEGATFVQWLYQTKESSLAAFEHQEVPFDQIVEYAGVSRGRQHHPLVQTLFVMQNMPNGRLEIPGLEIEAVPTQDTRSKFDVAVFTAQGPSGVSVDWVYATRLYRRPTMERVSAAWARLLERVAEAPDAPLDRVRTHRNEEPRMVSLPSPALGKLDKLKKIAGRPATAPRPVVRTSFLASDREFPLVIEAASSDIDAVAWAREQRGDIENRLRRHAGILFRNFGLRTPQEFEAFAEAMEPLLYGSYGDLPKKEGGRNTYRSTPYPERQMILYHNESSHLERWPRKQWFFCELPSPVGGATPVVDGREMLRRLPIKLVQEMERKELLYVRTFTPRLDVSWQDFFKTDDKSEVEARLRQAGTEWRWLDAQTLQTRTRCPAVITHPLTGERVFFNQVQLHHVSCLEPEVREDLLSMVGLERIPRHVYFGDGSPISDEAMATIGRAYEDCAVRFDWRQGDVVMLDNMMAAHARDPYEGPRKIVVAMGAMFERKELAHPRGAFGAPPQGGATSGPAEPDPRWPLEALASCAVGGAERGGATQLVEAGE
jgi:alpha-ketoglutarate-dependent taurine dioxygenase/acyl carrier protein